MTRSLRTMLLTASLALLAAIAASPQASAKDSPSGPGGGGGGGGACHACEATGAPASGETKCRDMMWSGNLFGFTACETVIEWAPSAKSKCEPGGSLCWSRWPLPTSPGYI